MEKNHKTGKKPAIKVIGIDSFGADIVNGMIDRNSDGIECIAVSTDYEALRESKAETKTLIGLGSSLKSDTDCFNKIDRFAYQKIQESLQGATLAVFVGGLTYSEPVSAALIVAAAREISLPIIGVTRVRSSQSLAGHHPETSNHGGCKMNRRMSEAHYAGCLLGGACGDALGWPVEFEDLDRIRLLTDEDGVTGMTPGKDGLFEITDDTQMTLFTAEGLLRGLTTARAAGSPPDFVAALKRSYLCWLATQGERGVESYPKSEPAGWLLAVEGLHEERGPGNTCLSALRATRFSGKDIAANDSKGCGGVMRAAPAGLLAARLSEEESSSAAGLAFEVGWQAAAITHGDPSGYFPAGVLAAVIACVVRGESIQKGVERSLGILKGHQDSGETVAAVQSALQLAQDQSQLSSPETVQTLGAGWIGSEALAIGLYCALVAGKDFARGVRLAVNHSGDSDSTGSITGNIMGALLGEKAIPPEWLEGLELGDVIRQVASDLLVGVEQTDDWLKKYPAI